MKQNVGNVDRVLRIVLGLVLIAASLLGYIGAWGWIGLIPLANGHIPRLPRLASRQELSEALGVAVYMGGGPSLMYAAKAVSAFEEYSS